MKSIKEFLGLGYYTSKLDLFLQNFDKTHPILSASQTAENKKSAILKPSPAKSPVNLPVFWDKL